MSTHGCELHHELLFFDWAYLVYNFDAVSFLSWKRHSWLTLEVHEDRVAVVDKNKSTASVYSSRANWKWWEVVSEDGNLTILTNETISPPHHQQHCDSHCRIENGQISFPQLQVQCCKWSIWRIERESHTEAKKESEPVPGIWLWNFQSKQKHTPPFSTGGGRQMSLRTGGRTDRLQ